MSIFASIRDQIELADVAARFTELKRANGKFLGSCPLPSHDDATPSFYVYLDGRWHCFGCCEHGDVIDLWAKVRGLKPGIEAALSLAHEYGLQLPGLDPDVQKEADERRQKEAAYAKQAEAYHQALSSHPNVVAYLEQRGFNEELRRRFLLGANRDGSAVVIPFWNRGRIQGLIRRQLDRQPRYLFPATHDFTCGYKPLFIPGSPYGDKHFVEGIFDALALAALDLSAIAVGGCSISQNQREELNRLSGLIYLFRDKDEAGEKAGCE